MFRHEGTARTDRQNQIVAGYLASIAGIVNSAGFILIGSFTSHVTGNVGRFANDLALRDAGAPFALLLVAAFFIGALLASMTLESTTHARPQIYSILLFIEAMLLAVFALLSYLMDTRNSRYHDVQAILLCVAMGMQNSFVTRLSGAVVRTTHLTGVVTDLGIEAARWFRLWRSRLGARARLRLVVGESPPEVPSGPRTRLLLIIVTTFLAGSAVGALSAAHWGQLSLLLPTLALLAAALFAAVRNRLPDLRA